MLSRWVRIVFVLLCLSFLLAQTPRASAQVVSAAISGTVTDPSSASVQGASVTARDVETGEERVTPTDAAGHYELLALPVGPYEVQVSKDGFQGVVRGGIHLVVGQQAVVDFSLAGRPGAAARYGKRGRSPGQPDHGGHLRACGRAAGKGSSAQWTQFRRTDDAESRAWSTSPGKRPAGS